jgi:hypothetical protein
MKGTNSNVLIAGAGPVGLAMAADLARYGVSVRLIEKSPERTDKSKALVLWSRTLELMDRMDCTAPFLTAGKKVTAVNITAGKELITRVTVDEVKTPHPYALTIPQNDTEELLGDFVTVHLSNVPNPEEIFISWHTDGILAVFPILGTRYRVIADSGLIDAGVAPSNPTMESLELSLGPRLCDGRCGAYP